MVDYKKVKNTLIDTKVRGDLIKQVSLTEKFQKDMVLKSTLFDTPLGSMFAISDENFLYLLEFADRHSLDGQLNALKCKNKNEIIPGSSSPFKQIESELKEYFNGSLREFKTPINLLGSPFQKLVWEELIPIPYAQTRSYQTQAIAIGKATAYRAVANANGANKLAIIVPCHRIINSNGNLGGYGGGVYRKKWLIDFEKEKYSKYLAS